MTQRGKRAGLAWSALMLAGMASIATPAGAADTVSGAASQQATLESKTRLVKLLLSQSPAVQRIPQSNNAQAQKKLAEAQSLTAKADAEAAAGRVEPAIKLLDKALLEITAAARLVPDAAQLASQERTRYTGLRESVRTFVSLHKSLAERMAIKKGAELDTGRIDGMLAKAEGLAGAANHKEANGVLNEAYKIVVTAISKMLFAETIVYDLKFDTPADEFKHELARNRSYEELIPLALKQLNPTRETAMLSERYVQRSKELRDLAQKQAGGGDYPSALKTIQDATGQLQRSLQIAGVVVPQSQEGKP
ncbi:MAG TPA: hypothetical protein VFF81_05430 [Noviherbaspirillum sp.]|nr:hypothetical protein [Noviherbaspirillum sp.]